jgi:pimeloyl-ACP methyl ester carboxylesterase
MRGEFIDLGGVRLYCYAFGERGAGAPIVLIHGAFTSSPSSSWIARAAAAAREAAAALRVVRVVAARRRRAFVKGGGAQESERALIGAE